MELMLSMDEEDTRSLIVALAYSAGTLLRLEREQHATFETPLGPMSRRLLMHAHSLTNGAVHTQLLALAVEAGESDAPFADIPVRS